MATPSNLLLVVFKSGTVNAPTSISPPTPVGVKTPKKSEYKCEHPGCDFTTSKPHKRRVHKWVEHGIGFGITYVCKELDCKFKTRKVEAYNKHIEFHKYHSNIICDVCRRSTKPLSPTKYKGFFRDQSFKICIECDHMYHA
jgi:hypothetical protein